MLNLLAKTQRRNVATGLLGVATSAFAVNQYLGNENTKDDSRTATVDEARPLWNRMTWLSNRTMCEAPPTRPFGFQHDVETPLADYTARLTKLQTMTQVFTHCAEEYDETTGSMLMSRGNFFKSRLCRSYYYKAERVKEMLQAFNRKDAESQGASLLDLLDDSDTFMTYHDFLFLNTLLSIPEEDIKVAFRVFDENSNGAIDVKEFRAVRRSILSLSNAEEIEEQHGFCGIEDRMERTLFGEDKAGTLEFETFRKLVLAMKKQLREFEYYYYVGEGPATMQSVCYMLVSYAPVYCIENLQRHIDSVSFPDTPVDVDTFVEIDRVLCDYHNDLHEVVNMFGADLKQDPVRILQRIVKVISGVEISFENLTSICLIFCDEPWLDEKHVAPPRVTRASAFNYKMMKSTLKSRSVANNLRDIAESDIEVRGIHDFKSLYKFMRKCAKS